MRTDISQFFIDTNLTRKTN